MNYSAASYGVSTANSQSRSKLRGIRPILEIKQISWERSEQGLSNHVYYIIGTSSNNLSYKTGEY